TDPNGTFWRSTSNTDNYPASQVISAGGTATFQMEQVVNTLGTWKVNGVFVWNATTNSYWGSLPANGQNQQPTFNVSSAPAPCADPSPREAWCTQMYANPDLSGTPLYVEVESLGSPQPVQADWGSGGPGHGLPVDNFSVRWSGRFNYDSGVWQFDSESDD